MDHEELVLEVSEMSDDECRQLCYRIARANLDEYPLTDKDFETMLFEVKYQ